MVQSADTSPQYSGKRRTYRHDLDRVVNGDLPSTAGSAKKCIVKLKNALKDFLNDLMPIGSANDIALMKSWMDKSIDFVEDVLKIVDKPESRLWPKTSFNPLMILPGAFVEGAPEASTTQSEITASNDEIAAITTAEDIEVTDQNQVEVNSPSIELIVSGFWIIIVEVVMLRRSEKRRKAFESLTENTNGLKLAVATW